MSHDADRRLLFSAAGLAGIAALTSVGRAGPLDPPQGPVAPSGRTLDEVYSRIPVPGAGGGRTPIPAGGPQTISSPGSYILAGNIQGNATGNALVIRVSGVDVDLNGFNVAGQPDLSAVVIDSNTSEGIRRVRVHNGTISDGAAGVSLGYNSSLIVLEDLMIDRCSQNGIRTNVNAASAVSVRRCIIAQTGYASFSPPPPFIPYSGITLVGSSITVTDCLIHNTTPPTGVTNFFGIQLGPGIGNSVTRCTLRQLEQHGGTGIELNGGGVYRENYTVNYITKYAGGIDAGGNY
jgi:hypothetical protein